MHFTTHAQIKKRAKIPRIPVQEVYYFRLLSVNTFGIHNLNTNNSFCYVYYEAITRNHKQ